MKVSNLFRFWISSMIALAAAGAALSEPAWAHDHASVHGMLVVGKERVFLSHLPMFHSPHDYQAILEAVLPPEVQAIYLRDMASHPDQKIYTLVPEPFVLPDMLAHPRPFKADLYRGHFERGGVAIASIARVGIARVVYEKQFDPSAVHPATLRYLAFGSPGGEQFLAHLITAKPDFDQVIETRGIAGDLPRAMEFSGVPAEAPLPETGDRKEIYLETGDLSE
jgi:hypothetical protein